MSIPLWFRAGQVLSCGLALTETRQAMDAMGWPTIMRQARTVRDSVELCTTSAVALVTYLHTQDVSRQQHLGSGLIYVKRVLVVH
jgi:hypothetical protein